MGFPDLWRVAPDAYLRTMAALRNWIEDQSYPSREPACVYGLSQHRERAEEMGRWCEDNGMEVRVVHTPTVHFIELFDLRDAVMFKFRWA